MTGLIKRSWNGDEKLWVVFWVYFMLSMLVLKAAIPLLMAIFKVQGVQAIVIYIFLLLYVVYVVWLYRSLWMCAFNSNWKLWGYAVRTLVVVSVVSIVGNNIYAIVRW